MSLNQSCERGRERIACAVAVLQRRLEWMTAKNERDRVKSSRMNEESAVSQWLVTLLSGKGPEVHASLLDLARRNRMPQEIDDDDPRYGAAKISHDHAAQSANSGCPTAGVACDQSSGAA